MKLTPMELGWLVGLLEGEGAFGFYGNQHTVNLQMCDEDIVFRYGQLLVKCLDLRKFPTIGCLTRANRIDMYQLSLKGPTAKQVMKLVVPYMGTRRRAKIWQALNNYKQPKSTLTQLSILLATSKEPTA